MASDPKNPSTKWYFNDWDGDHALKACSLAAQGLWMRLLCIAARSPEPGVVQIGDQPLKHPDGLAPLALAVGRPLEEIAPLIDELLRFGVADRDRSGRLKNRRMVRAVELSAKLARNGARGAAVTHGNRGRKEGLPSKHGGKPPALHDSNTSLTSSHGETGTDPARGADAERAKWLERLAGYRPWEGKKRWLPFWGLGPDSAGVNPLIPRDLRDAWRAEERAARLDEGMRLGRMSAGSGNGVYGGNDGR